jgi:endo-1,4-beta-xylanase
MKNTFSFLFFFFVFSLTKLHTQLIIKAKTTKHIIVDGLIDIAWAKAQPYAIQKLQQQHADSLLPMLNTSASAKFLAKDGLLYVLVQVQDSDIFIGPRPNDADAVEVFLDYYNDKFPKYEEDDQQFRLTTNATYTSIGATPERLFAHAIKKNDKGYNVEFAIELGGKNLKKGSKYGIEIAVCDASNINKKLNYKLLLAHQQHNGINNSSLWATLTLAQKKLAQPDSFGLQQQINYAQNLPVEIWQNLGALNAAIANAKTALLKKNKANTAKAQTALEQSIKNLRRSGPMPDPYDLPEILHLPNPFAMANGNIITSPSQWPSRVAELRIQVEYYEYGHMPAQPEKVTASYETQRLQITVQNAGKSSTFAAKLTLPTSPPPAGASSYPVIVGIDFFDGPPPAPFLEAGYAVLSFVYRTVASDNMLHQGTFYDLYPYNVAKGHDYGTLLAWAWGASRCVDALYALQKEGVPDAIKLDLSKLTVTGFSRCGKAALCAGFFDERFGLVSPGASGCGGAAVYRYASFSNTPNRQANFGNTYSWGTSFGAEVLGDKVRHQGHNANQMLGRFLSQDRMYKTKTHGYANRLPYDHHQIIAAIAPRAVLITTATDDYSNNAEGDAIGFEGAKPVFEFLGVLQNLALNLRTTNQPHPRFGGGHWLSEEQQQNLVTFANQVFYKIPITKVLAKKLYENPYQDTFDTYYGGLKAMMPWR